MKVNNRVTNRLAYHIILILLALALVAPMGRYMKSFE